MSTENVIEKANKALSIANFVIYIVCLVCFFGCGDWFGGRWYHWVLSFILALVLKAFLGVVAKETVKVSFGLVEPGDNNNNDNNNSSNNG